MTTTTENATHPFEVAGLGKAPYKFVGVTKELFQACVGESIKAGASCDYCAESIVNAHWFLSADGKRFKVGCDCFSRWNNCPKLASKVAAANLKLQREQRAARAVKVDQDLDAYLADESVRAELAAKPHPKGFSGLTALDYAVWMAERAGKTGRAKALKQIKLLLK